MALQRFHCLFSFVLPPLLFISNKAAGSEKTLQWRNIVLHIRILTVMIMKVTEAPSISVDQTYS
jgi:hypothetical protein